MELLGMKVLVRRAASLSHIVAFSARTSWGMGVLEICGGQGVVSRVCVRRKCRVGPSFDIICGSDLCDANEQWTLRCGSTWSGER
eukprot:7387930-Pyramimonas_sp.AAC.1